MKKRFEGKQKRTNKLKDKVMTSLAIAVIIHGAATGKLFGNDELESK